MTLALVVSPLSCFVLGVTLSRTLDEADALALNGEIRELLLACAPKLKGSIGEGPNHSNFSDQSSVKIQELLLYKIKNHVRNLLHVQHFLKYRRNSDKISSKSEKKSMKS